MKLLYAICCSTLLSGIGFGADEAGPDISFLLKTLEHPAPIVRERAADELKTAGEPAAIALAALLRDGNLLSATKAAVVLARMRDEAVAATPVLLGVLRDDRAGEWRWSLALHALREMSPEARLAALPPAVAALESRQPMKQFGAIQLVMALKKEAHTAAGPLRGLLSRDRAPFRSIIVRDAVIAENRVSLMEEAPIYDDLLILDAMRLVGVPEEELAPLLAVRAANARPGVRLLAAAQLGALGPKSKIVAGNTFALLLDDESPGIRETAIEALAKLGAAGVAATDRLCRLLRDTDPDLRLQAAMALGEIGPAAGAQGVRSLEAAIQIERLLAAGAGPISAMARLRAEKMTDALDKVRKADLE